MLMLMTKIKLTLDELDEMNSLLLMKRVLPVTMEKMRLIEVKTTPSEMMTTSMKMTTSRLRWKEKHLISTDVELELDQSELFSMQFGRVDPFDHVILRLRFLQ